MTDQNPPRDDDTAGPAPDEATPTASDAQSPVFDDVTAEHPEVRDAAPELIEPEPAAPAEVPLAESIETPALSQDAPSDTAETTGYEEHIDERPVAAEPVAAAPVAADAEPVAAAAAAPAAAAQPMQTVYVSAPVAPRKKGNRGFGLLFALLAVIAFALLFMGIMAIVLGGLFPGDFVDRLTRFASSSAFIVPVVVFIVAFALLVLLTNRAGWWAYVLGSFLVALAVYFGSIGVVLLTGNVFGMTADTATATFWNLAASPSIIIAGILAREVTIWFGAAIAARGRKVKERNLEARAAYERELDNQPLGFS